MSLAAKQAVVCWLAALALIVVALFVFLGSPASAGGASEAVGRVFAHTGIAALVCWFIARGRTPPWSWVRFVLVYVALVVVLGIVANAGRAHAGSRNDPEVAGRCRSTATPGASVCARACVAPTVLESDPIFRQGTKRSPG